MFFFETRCTIRGRARIYIYLTQEFLMGKDVLNIKAIRCGIVYRCC